MLSNPAVDYFMQRLATQEVKQYKKFGKFTARQNERKRQVDTVIDGKLETTNTANPGDWIVTGRKGEQYVLTPDKFQDRYKALGGGVYEATGSCYAVEYTGLRFTFEAPWGESMLCEPGDYLCSTRTDGSDVYRIARTAFNETYKRD